MERILYAVIVQAIGVAFYRERYALEKAAFERHEELRVFLKLPPDSVKTLRLNYWAITAISLFSVAIGAYAFARAIVIQCSTAVSVIAIATDIVVMGAILFRWSGNHCGEKNH